jgi:hypothetical protein
VTAERARLSRYDFCLTGLARKTLMRGFKPGTSGTRPESVAPGYFGSCASSTARTLAISRVA